MLKTIIRYAIFHYQKEDSKNGKNDNLSHITPIISQKHLLHALVHMTDYVRILFNIFYLSDDCRLYY